MAPLDYLSKAAGYRAATTLPLTWFVIIISVVVCLVIAALLWIGAWRAVARGGATETSATTLSSDRSGIGWIIVGLAVSAVPLLVTLIWTMAAIAHVTAPPRRPEMVIDVTGNQWWWAAQYHGATPAETFDTANEIHIPVGEPVTIRLHGGDVIHSFWVPKLAGKTDTIPGQQNVTWLQADKPGRYRGQCTEFCGAQHAKMGFVVVAEPRDQFERWRQAQLQTAPPPTTPAEARGLALVTFRCGLCHTVRGTDAGSHVGPDLTHLMSRQTIAAAMLPNNPGSLAGWIQAPQAIKPGARMPDQRLTGPQLTDVTAYLETLR